LTIVACYAIAVGLGMVGWWSFSLATRRVPELSTEPSRIVLHLAGEYITAAALLASGFALLADTAWATQIALVSLGMLIHTAIVSPGYFLHKGQRPLAAMFGLIVALAAASAAFLAHQSL
jgi:hypothetical protein